MKRDRLVARFLLNMNLIYKGRKFKILSVLIDVGRVIEILANWKISNFFLIFSIKSDDLIGIENGRNCSSCK